MIYRVFSTLESFKTLEFAPNLNIVLSDKTLDATDQQTRNRSGKTSFIELVHFLCGSNCGPDSLFRAQEISQKAFGIELDLFDEVTQISRSGAEPSKIV